MGYKMGWQDWMVEGVPKDVIQMREEFEEYQNNKTIQGLDCSVNEDSIGLDYEGEYHRMVKENTLLKKNNDALKNALINLALKM